MLQNDNVTDSFDRDMLPFYESDDYKYQHATNNLKIQTFRSKLNPELQAEFNVILNNLSDEYAEATLAAYQCSCTKESKSEPEYSS